MISPPQFVESLNPLSTSPYSITDDLLESRRHRGSDTQESRRLPRRGWRDFDITEIDITDSDITEFDITDTDISESDITEIDITRKGKLI